jgi:hypothetical protein
MPLTRRRFVTVVVAALASVGLPLPALARLASNPNVPLNPWGRRKIYRLSGRGRRVSNAARAHNANMRFATANAASKHPAHIGDRSKVVAEFVSIEDYQRLFVDRRTHVVDLRKVPRTIG